MTTRVNNKFLQKVSLRSILALAFAVVSIGAIFSISMLNAYTAYQSSKTATHSDLFKSAQIVAARVDGYVGEIVSAISSTSIGETKKIFNRNELTRHSALNKIMASHPGIREVWNVSPRGKIIDFVSRFKIETAEQLKDRWNPVFQHIDRSLAVQFGQIRFTDISSEPLIDIAISTSKAGMNPTGAVVATLSLKYLWDLLEVQATTEAVRAYAFSKDGKLIGHSDRSKMFLDVAVPNHVIGSLIHQPNMTSKEYQSVQGEMIGGFATISRLAIGIIVEKPISESLRSANRSILNSLVISIVLGILAILVGISLARLIVRPLEALSEVAAKIARAKTASVVEPSGTLEIFKLGNTFNHMTYQLAASIEQLESQIRTVEQSERALRESKTSFQNLFEYSEVSIWNEDMSAVCSELNKLRENGLEDLRQYLSENEDVTFRLVQLVKVLQVNEATLKLFGAKNQQDMLGRIDRTFGSKAMDIFVDELVAIWSGAAVFRAEADFWTFDGEAIHAIIAFRIPKSEAEFKNVPVSIIDITGLKRAEYALNESEMRFKVVFDKSFQFSLVLDSNGVVTEMNELCVTACGKYSKNVVGNPLWDAGWWRDFPHTVAKTQKAVQGVKRGKVVIDEIEFVDKDDAIHQGVRTFTPIFGNDGQVNYISVAGLDITERLNAEQEKMELERHLAQAQKMEAVGQLTGGVAHDFNNLLQVIQGNLELIELGSNQNDTAELLTTAKSAVKRGADLTQQLLAYSRSQTLSPETINPNNLLGDMIDLLKRTIGENIEIEALFENEIQTVFIDSNKLQNAILNLAINSKGAMENGGKIILGTKSVKYKSAQELNGTFLPEGDYVAISVEDNGSGMTEGVLSRSIEPFFTTKGVGEGSGLGLSMVHGFTEQSGGHLTIDSKPDIGTKVEIVLPVSVKNAIDSEEVQVQKGSENLSGTILVVEDDPAVRKIVAKMIENLGYKVLEAEDAYSALNILEQSDNVDLLFSDVVMPKGLSGVDLAAEASLKYSHLKVVLTSGYPDSEINSLGKSKIKFKFLRKPYSGNDLASTLVEALT